MSRDRLSVQMEIGEPDCNFCPVCCKFTCGGVHCAPPVVCFTWPCLCAAALVSMLVCPRETGGGSGRGGAKDKPGYISMEPEEDIYDNS
ncbi:hypothetical protein Pelo_10202 [Pelomyxa schiedti]|nr:hypothetical protein Pelo_10202 [Pelomyxa schiedti]